MAYVYDYAKIEEQYKKQEQEEIEIFSRRPTIPPITEEEFDQIGQQAAEEFHQNPDKWGTAGDSSRMAQGDIAFQVNPVEYYRVWFSRSPCRFSTYGHTLQYITKATYYIDKALACGIAKTAEEAVQYFNNKK